MRTERGQAGAAFTFREKQARDGQWVEGALEKVGELRNRGKAAGRRV